MNFDLPELTPETPQGALCQVKVSELKPTQNAIGFDEVNNKIARYSAKSKEDLRDYLLVHSVPIVIGNGNGNGGRFYLTDHHHMANALWKTAEGENKAGIDTGNARVVARVQYNRHGLEGYHFCLHHAGLRRHNPCRARLAPAERDRGAERHPVGRLDDGLAVSGSPTEFDGQGAGAW